jgi:hypothetical protein
MLDDLGMSQLLGITSSHALFADRVDLLHATSAVRYPVVVRGEENYSGSSPRLSRHQKLRSMMREYLVYELSHCPGALVIPLGKYVGEAILELASEGLVEAKRCLFGFPHPSGGNGHRAKQFEARREDLAHTMHTWFSKQSVHERAAPYTAV